MQRDRVWRIGEETAVGHLEGLGWSVQERNWRCPAGEIDIIALQPGVPPTVVFCEVKCRTGSAFGSPLEAITARKIAKLRELALLWLSSHPGPERAVRIDGIGVVLTGGRPTSVSHVRGVG